MQRREKLRKFATDEVRLCANRTPKTNIYMAEFQLKGMGVALVTPFNEDKSIDTYALANLIDYIIAGGADFLVVMGTTAETPTFSKEEKDLVRYFVRTHVNGRVPLVIGIGGNSTENVCRELRETDLTGYSAVLSVVPYYNKPRQEGIYLHYKAIAEASPLPVILYNVPGRTGVNMDAETTLRLAEVDNIIGVKEASGNFAQIEAIVKHKPKGFNVISGDDGITYPLICMGATGVISVLGNVCPAEFERMVSLALSGDFASARAIHHEFAEMYSLLFRDGNPAGVKAALASRRLVKNELRLPLVPVRPEVYDGIAAELERVSKK